MKKKKLVLKLIGWVILLQGMGVFLFVKETTLPVRIFAVACNIAAMVLFSIENKI